MRAAGAAPISIGEHGYGRHLDRDGDGIGCESGNSGATSSSTNRAPVLVATSATTSKAKNETFVVATFPNPIVGQAQVLDGDTLQIGTTRIRLFGIDAFEGEQSCISDRNTYSCGGIATRTLSEEIDGRAVVCISKGTDVYERTLAVCRVESTDLSSFMARKGFALAYVKYSNDYVPDEQFAKETRAGAWTGTFLPPWEYRSTRQAAGAEAQRMAIAPSSDCTIKGNVNRKGKRIYHMPSDPYYSRTKPENWFCSTEEAERAGFRRAGQSK